MSTESQRVGKDWLGGCFFALLGGAFLIFAIGQSLRAVSQWFGTERASGTVVAFRPSGEGRVPVVRYQVGGKDYQCEGRIAIEAPSLQVGQTVDVLYAVGFPSEGYLNTFTERWLFPVAFGGIGLVFAGAGWWMLSGRVTATSYIAISTRRTPASPGDETPGR